MDKLGAVHRDRRIRSLYKIGSVVFLLLGLMFITLLPRFRRDSAELTLRSVKAETNGQVTATLEMRLPYGVRLRSIYHDDGKSRLGSTNGRKGYPFTGSDVSSTIEFHLNPEHSPSSGAFTNSPQFSRLKLRVGQVYKITEGESLALYDFNNGGIRHAWIYEIVPPNEPWADEPH